MIATLNIPAGREFPRESIAEIGRVFPDGTVEIVGWYAGEIRFARVGIYDLTFAHTPYVDSGDGSVTRAAQ